MFSDVDSPVLVEQQKKKKKKKLCRHWMPTRELSRCNYHKGWMVRESLCNRYHQQTLMVMRRRIMIYYFSLEGLGFIYIGSWQSEQT